ncbi:MAG: hypothetical protein WDZ80_03705 [Candidatus Paceibacterota bacterium]
MKKSDWSGLDKLMKRAEKLERTQNVPYSKLFNSAFMNLYTQHTSIETFFEAGGFEFETEKEFENLSEEKLDQHVQASTKFKSWNEMFTKAGENWVAKELGF